MKRSLPFVSTVACSAAAVIPLFIGAPAYAATACADLAKLELPETKITLAERVPAGDFKAPGVQQPLKVPALCRVTGTVAPAINFEVWLPEGSSWNGRFQAVGGGGLAGIISYPAMAEAVRNGYASSSTDTGHVVDRYRVALRSPARRRLRLSRDSRDDGEGESRHRHALRPRAASTPTSTAARRVDGKA